MRGRTTRIAGLVAGIALMGGCRSDRITATRAGTKQLAAASRNPGRAVQTDLATLRRVTAPFHDLHTAMAAGWSTQITGCMASPAGGMGFHYGNTAYIDGIARVDQPELLLYEPEQNGKMRLVAVEYIIPYTAHPRDAAPPVLFGQQFKQNDAFQLWGLHVWVWKHNPSGMFADWNPKVTCRYAPGNAAPMAD